MKHLSEPFIFRITEFIGHAFTIIGLIIFIYGVVSSIKNGVLGGLKNAETWSCPEVNLNTLPSYCSDFTSKSIESLNHDQAAKLTTCVIKAAKQQVVLHLLR